jgi:Flp pilus assembly protein TadG
VSTIEVVVLAPVIILFVLILVAFGQLVDGRGAVDGAARDAARAGSLQRTGTAAIGQATTAARNDLRGTCARPAAVTAVGDTRFLSDTLYTIQVTCVVRGLRFLGLPVAESVTSTSASPLDPFRRAVPN